MIPFCVVGEHVFVPMANLRLQGVVIVDNSHYTGLSDCSKLSDDMVLISRELVGSVRVAEQDTLLVAPESANSLSCGSDVFLWLR